MRQSQLQSSNTVMRQLLDGKEESNFLLLIQDTSYQVEWGDLAVDTFQIAYAQGSTDTWG